MKKTITLFILKDFLGDVRVTVTEEPSDIGTLLGVGFDNMFHQYDSNPVYKAYDWAGSLGMKLKMRQLEIDIPDEYLEI